MAFGHATALKDERLVTRDEVHFRTRGTGPDGASIPMLIVNMSAMGLMARCDAEFAVDAPLKITLPIVGEVRARVRWSLGGRIGCELDEVIGLALYYEVLAALLKQR